MASHQCVYYKALYKMITKRMFPLLGIKYILELLKGANLISRMATTVHNTWNLDSQMRHSYKIMLHMYSRHIKFIVLPFGLISIQSNDDANVH